MIEEIKASNEALVESLLIDLDVALTIMDVAKTTEFRNTARRNHLNARKAYDTVTSRLRDLTPNAAQQAMFNEKLAELRSRLEAVGQL